MVCPRAPLAQHSLAGQASTQRASGFPTHTRPQQHALAAPWPPHARHCAGCSAVCPQWHTASTKAQTHHSRLRAAVLQLAPACAHEELSMRSWLAHRERMRGITQATQAQHCTALQLERTTVLQADTLPRAPQACDTQRRHGITARHARAHAAKRPASRAAARRRQRCAAPRTPPAFATAHAGSKLCAPDEILN